MERQSISTTDAWSSLNERYLAFALERLRLLLRRKVLWLRTVWDEDPLEGFQGRVVSDTRADRALSRAGARAERAFYRENDGARSVGEELERVREMLARHRETMREAGVVPAHELIGRIFGLTTFERDVLLLCLAPEVDGSFQKLYAYVQDDPARTYATPQLALQLFVETSSDNDAGSGAPRADVWNRFTSHAPLRRYRLIEMSGSPTSEVVRSARPIHLDERITAYLRGENRMDERASAVLSELPSVPVPPVHDDVIDRLVPVLASRLEQGVRPAVHLKGSETSGKEAVARVLGRRLNLDCYRIDAEKLPSAADERRRLLRLLEREAVLLQAAYYVEPQSVGTNEDASETLPEDLLEQLDATLFVGGGLVGDVERTVYDVRLPKPDPAVQEETWRRVLGDDEVRLNGRAGEIAQQFDFGPHRMVKAVDAARNRVQVDDPDREIRADDLWEACRDQARVDMDDLARPITPNYTWDDIVLPEDTFDQLREIAAQVDRRTRVYGDWGFDDRLSRGLGISALFAGPSGTGKTMAAEILADHLDLDLYRIDLASMVSKYIGETEKNLKKVFDAAERSGAILFFDEADALFGKRTEVSDSHDRYANIEIDYLLQRMEEYRGLAVLATNRKGDMDRAFLRRLRFVVEFPRPDAEHRRMIWEHAFPPDAPVGTLDYGFLSRLEITGANIQNIALNAAFLAAEDEDSIEMPHVMHAARREYGKIGKLITESEFGAYYERK